MPTSRSINTAKYAVPDICRFNGSVKINCSIAKTKNVNNEQKVISTPRNAKKNNGAKVIETKVFVASTNNFLVL